MRLLAIGTVVALLTWGAVEAIAAARPSVPEPPSASALEDGGDAPQAREPLPRAAQSARDSQAKLARLDHPETRERTTSTLPVWHPTRHARDDSSPDH